MAIKRQDDDDNEEEDEIWEPSESKAHEGNMTLVGDLIDQSEVEALEQDRESHLSGGITKPTKDEGSPADSSVKAQKLNRVRFKETRHKNGYIETSDVDGRRDPAADEKEEDHDYAFIWTTTFDEAGKYSWTVVRIESDRLAQLLRNNLSHDAAFPRHDTVMRFRSPFAVLLHNWAKLKHASEAKSGDDESNSARRDLKQLMKQVSTTIEVAQYFLDFDPTRTPKPTTINFEFLWTLFPTGRLVYSAPVMEQDQVFIVQDLEESLDKNNKRVFVLTCWSYDWDGATFNRVSYDFRIESFSGTKSINTLDHYPLEYHRDEQQLRNRLMVRGKKYREQCICKSGAQLFSYDGPCIEGQKGITGQDYLIPNRVSFIHGWFVVSGRSHSFLLLGLQ